MTQALAGAPVMKQLPSEVRPRARRLARAQGTDRELWYRPTITGWTPEKVEQARDGAESGLMMELADLVETMHRDARVAGVLSTRTHGMLGLPLSFDGGSDRAREALSAKDEADQMSNWWRMHDESELAKLLRWGLMLGVGVAQRIELPRLVGRPHRYRIQTWSPRWMTYYHYGYGAGRTGPEWRILTQHGQEAVIPGDGQWIVFLPYGERRPWTEGLWTQLAFPWLLKHFSMEDRANFSETLGSPIWVGSTAHGGTERQRNSFLSQLKGLGKNGKIVLPEKWDLQLREAQSAGKSGDVFSQQIKDSNDEMTIALAGQLVTTEGTPGFSSGNIHEAIKQDLLRFDAIRLASCLRDQSLEPWSLVNYGSRSAAPFPKWQTELPADVAEEADGMKKLGDAVTALNSALSGHGVRIDVQALMDKFNIPLIKSAPTPGASQTPALAPRPA